MSEYKIGDKVSHDGHITEIVGVTIKYMLCGGAVVYAHDLEPVKQCDGCRLGWPLDGRGNHTDRFGRPDMVCQGRGK